MFFSSQRALDMKPEVWTWGAGVRAHPASSQIYWTTPGRGLTLSGPTYTTIYQAIAHLGVGLSRKKGMLLSEPRRVPNVWSL